MTDYILHKKNNTTTAKDLGKKSHKKIFIILVVLILVFAVINIACRSFGAAKAVSTSSWDGRSSFSVLIGKYIFVYQQDPKRIALLNTGNDQSIDSDANKKLSRMMGVPLDYYFNMKNKTFDNFSTVEDSWKNFTSYLTPVKMITGFGLESLDTNISRYDALKLWWQAKSIGANNMETVDLGKIQTVGNNKILGANLSDINRTVKKYFENVNIIQEKLDIHIVNSSGEDSAGDLLSNFITSVGGEVAGINSTTDEHVNCKILTTGRNYTVDYLAKVFECDINDAPEGENEGEITIFVGSDFSKKYFE